MIAAIVLAAGLSRRMGGRPKLLLRVGNQPLIRLAVQTVLKAVDDVVVVTGQNATAVQAALADLPVCFARNPQPENGQGSSISVGVRALVPGTEAVVIALGDQPAVPAEVVPELVATWRRTGKAIVAPVYAGTQGTPVLFAAAVFAELRALAGEGGARRVVEAQPGRVARVAFAHAMPADVDTPEDYHRLHVE